MYAYLYHCTVFVIYLETYEYIFVIFPFSFCAFVTDQRLLFYTIHDLILL